MTTIPIIIEINEEIITIEIPNPILVEIGYEFSPFTQQKSNWDSSFGVTEILNKPTTTASFKQAVRTVSSNTVLTLDDEIVVFTSNGNAQLPVSTGSGKTYRIIARNSTVMILPDGLDTTKGESYQTISGNEDLIISDTEIGIWE